MSQQHKYSEFSLRDHPAKFQPFQVGDKKRVENEDPGPYKRWSYRRSYHNESPHIFGEEECEGTGVRRSKLKRKSLKDGKIPSRHQDAPNILDVQDGRIPSRHQGAPNILDEDQGDVSPCSSEDESSAPSERRTQHRATFDWSDILGHTPQAAIFAKESSIATADDQDMDIDSIVGIITGEPESKLRKTATKSTTSSSPPVIEGTRERQSRKSKDVAKERLHCASPVSDKKGINEGSSRATSNAVEGKPSSTPSNTMNNNTAEKWSNGDQLEHDLSASHTPTHTVDQSEFSLLELDQSDSGIFNDSVNSLDSSNEGQYLGNQSSLTSLLNDSGCLFPLGGEKRPPFSTSTPIKSGMEVSMTAQKSSHGNGCDRDPSKPRTRATSSTQQADKYPEVYSVGSIVWGKFWKNRWFPAIVIDGRLANQKPARRGFVWLMWFGDYKISKLRQMLVAPFYKLFEERCGTQLKPQAEKAVAERCGTQLKPQAEKAVVDALQACAERLNIEFPTYKSILKWRFSDTFQNYLQQGLTEARDPFAMPQGSSLPHKVVKNLKKISSEKVHLNSEDSGSENDENVMLVDQNLPRSACRGTKTEKKQILGARCTKTEKNHTSVAICTKTEKNHTSVARGTRTENTQISRAEEKRNITDFCLPCGKHGQTSVDHHPLFEGYICAKCKDSIRETVFALDDDGCCLFCNICGEGGQLLVCDSLDCGRSFCMNCVKKYISHESIKQIKARSPWLCFLCTPYSHATHGYLMPRDKWRLDLLNFFNPVQLHLEDDLTSYNVGEKRKLRVLSLFDGIGTVKLALDQLGLDIEVYYACETNADAQMVTRYNHGSAVVQLGDAYKLNRQTLQDICPIDLVVGSPPTHDLDVAYHDFEGFNETGMLSVKFLMILHEVELLSGADNHVFWLLENTASMKSEFYKILAQLFEGEPCMWDGQYFSGHLHSRLYWGNLPGLYSAVEYCSKHDSSEITLQSVIGKSINRKAMVSKLRAPSIPSNPVKLSKGRDSVGDNCVSHRRPVLMDGKPDGVWINEVERVFGLPEHYTDASVLKIRERQKLMTWASSVPLLKHLLSPLTRLFAVKQ